MKNSPKRITLTLTILLVSSCAVLGANKLVTLFGPETVHNRSVSQLNPGDINYWDEVKPILDRRCVVCHACYDAPCQLKLGSLEGIERGASKARVYEQTRLVAAAPSRLFEDAQTTEQWRDMGFYSVLNEHRQTQSANEQASALYQLLLLKEKHPLPESELLPDDFTLSINRESSCPKNNEVEKFAKQHPLWGMPYALPKLEDKEQSILKKWVQQGATHTEKVTDRSQHQALIHRWESFLNQDTNKGRLVSRYLYEHLFLAHLHFDDESIFFRLIRSATPPGQPVKFIATRRPYDDPKVTRVYYRIIEEKETPSLKTHMPYRLSDKRMTLWQKLFYDTPYDVETLPGYADAIAANPFKSFINIPMQSRYKFLLDEAQFSIMNFIKGPVCRGQGALNVIQDQFWVFFVDPDIDQQVMLEEVIKENADNLELPSAEDDIYFPIQTWRKYADKRQRYRESMNRFIEEQFTPDNVNGLDIIWNGEHTNPNAALTIFRHFNSASVEKGLVGSQPKTAWLIGYTLLERIHYLLAAGYDVYGNVGHQVFSRLHMDFLRMEGESNFLKMLPLKARLKERALWYENSPLDVLKYLNNPDLGNSDESMLKFYTQNPKQELYEQLKNHLGKSIEKTEQFNKQLTSNVFKPLAKIDAFKGAQVSLLAETSILEVIGKKQNRFFTILKNTGHMNITSLLREKHHLKPADNTVSVLPSISSAYPNVFFSVQEHQLSAFAKDLVSIETKKDYRVLLDRYAIRRTDTRFWSFSDRLHKHWQSDDPIRYGLLDYNRLENR